MLRPLPAICHALKVILAREVVHTLSFQEVEGLWISGSQPDLSVLAARVATNQRRTSSSSGLLAIFCTASHLWIFERSHKIRKSATCARSCVILEVLRQRSCAWSIILEGPFQQRIVILAQPTLPTPFNSRLFNDNVARMLWHGWRCWSRWQCYFGAFCRLANHCVQWRICYAKAAVHKKRALKKRFSLPSRSQQQRRTKKYEAHRSWRL